ncbi:MAG: acyl-CoA N-acyltransferase [Deltaproteobacteria bacterium]|nr:acyl-CoA N-acyltransferase [Deltaproteobacteria bacterium]
MIVSRQFLDEIKLEASRVGYGRAIERALYNTANKFVCLRRLEIILLTRDQLAPLEAAKHAMLTSRLATEHELRAMRAERRWEISDELIEGFRAGDSCLLSFVGGKRAGYTWIHTAGRPRLCPGLRISVPQDYAYNFAGFTLPEFRGYGLQPYRHHEILSRPEWRDRKGMLGYVQCVNWSSRRGQAKSGYQPAGSISLVGTLDRFTAVLSSEVKQLGIRRIDD